MLKAVFIFLLGLLCFQTVKAQKQDTLLYYMKNSGDFVNDKDSADYFLFIMPQDSTSGLYPVYEYYPNGKIKLAGFSNTKQYKQDGTTLEGSCVTYFSNGNRESRTNYKDGKAYSNFIEYFPNGKIYNIGNINENGQLQLIECRDSTGVILAENGNGRWIYLDKDFKNITLQGSVKDSLKEGEWDGMDEGRVACLNIYKHGEFITGVYYLKSGKKHSYLKETDAPEFDDGGQAGFYQYLSKSVKFPSIDRERGTQGKVIATFVVERDGRLTNTKILRSPSREMGEAITKVIQQSPPWIPGIQNGMPVRVQYTISFAFSLADSN